MYKSPVKKTNVLYLSIYTVSDFLLSPLLRLGLLGLGNLGAFLCLGLAAHQLIVLLKNLKSLQVVGLEQDFLVVN